MKLLAIDGNSIINRAFYAIRPLSTKDGLFTNGIFGFMNILLRLQHDVQPDGIAVAFDLKAPTFRHQIYSQYKAGRKPMPDELAQQLPLLKELLRDYGCHVLEQPGYEADDLLGTLSEICKRDCVISTGDRDALQLVTDQVRVLLAATKAGQPVITAFDPAAVQEKYGVSPAELIEVKALQGDSSDNIPGVPGIGEKTACALIAAYHSIDYIYSHLDELEITKSVRAKLEAGKDSAYLSRTLGTICKTAPIDPDPAAYAAVPMDRAALARLLTRLEMFKMIDRLGLQDAAAGAQTDSETSSQPEQSAQLQVIQDENADISGCAILYTGETLAAKQPDGPVTLLRQNAAAALQKGRALCTHDCKALYHSLQPDTAPDMAFDTMLAGYLLSPDQSDYSIGRLCAQYGVRPPAQEDAAGAVRSLEALHRQMARQLADNGQTDLLTDIELPLAYTLYTMERAGFAADAAGIAAFGDELAERIERLQAQIYEIIGYSFNLNSPKQLGQALFEKLGLPHGKKTKTGYSTSAEVLENLRYESDAVALLLEYRSLSKLKSTYCDGLLKQIGPDGRIHSTFKQAETRTGRISSTEPNLQNIPVRTPLGRQMRRFFTAREDWLLIDADYSQIELRVLAHIAGDENMKAAFLSGADIHTATAAQVFGLPKEMVTPELRSRAKAVNFGIVYGIGAFSLSKDIGVTVAQAKRYIEDYLTVYSGVRDYMDRVVQQAKADGYVTTAFGRRRYLPELSSSNFNTRSFGERVARNMPIQGTAADIIKLAMIRVQQRLEREGLKARLILQVHDELICEAPPQECQQVAALLKQEMEGAVQFDVPLTVDVHWGRTWYDAK